MAQRPPLADARGRLAHYRCNHRQKAQRNLTVGLYPIAEVISELGVEHWLRNRFRGHHPPFKPNSSRSFATETAVTEPSFARPNAASKRSAFAGEDIK